MDKTWKVKPFYKDSDFWHRTIYVLIIFFALAFIHKSAFLMVLFGSLLFEFAVFIGSMLIYKNFRNRICCDFGFSHELRKLVGDTGI